MIIWAASKLVATRDVHGIQNKLRIYIYNTYKMKQMERLQISLWAWVTLAVHESMVSWGLFDAPKSAASCRELGLHLGFRGHPQHGKSSIPGHGWDVFLSHTTGKSNVECPKDGSSEWNMSFVQNSPPCWDPISSNIFHRGPYIPNPPSSQQFPATSLTSAGFVLKQGFN
jgi:hypothetical protein